MARTVYILRGISGSGKSTWVRKNLPAASVVSTDNFWMQDGEYFVDVSRLEEAHADCFSKFCRCLSRGDCQVVVDNTNGRVWQFRRYMEEAAKAGYDIKVVTIFCDPAIAAARNIHNTPPEIIERQHQKLMEGCAEELPRGVAQEIVMNEV